METNIEFRPITKIRKFIKGKTTTLFIPKYTYKGVKYPDGTIFAYSPMHDKPIELNENDIMIQ